MRSSQRTLFEGGPVHPIANRSKAIADTLIPDMMDKQKTPEFADMYAQSIVYGLFAARCNHREGRPFERTSAAHEIPKTNPFLHNTCARSPRALLGGSTPGL